jgi:hypothetical protein
LPKFIFRKKNNSFYVLRDPRASNINLSKIDFGHGVKQSNVSSVFTQLDTCCLCCINKSDAVIMDCGHGGSCYSCAIKMWKNGENCFLCRSLIREVLQVVSDDNMKHGYKVVSATFCMDQKNLNEINKIYRDAFENNQEDEKENRNVSIIEEVEI